MWGRAAATKAFERMRKILDNEGGALGKRCSWALLGRKVCVRCFKALHGVGNSAAHCLIPGCDSIIFILTKRSMSPRTAVSEKLMKRLDLDSRKKSLNVKFGFRISDFGMLVGKIQGENESHLHIVCCASTGGV